MVQHLGFTEERAAMTLPAKTLAAVAVNVRETQLRELPLPDVALDGGLMRVDATGICGSDWPMYLNAKPGPRILGHEMVGTVVKLGDIARARWGLVEGDVVALEEYLPCGHCEYCRTGEYRSCLETDTQFAGSVRYGSTPLTVDPGLWGGYSQYLYLHPRSVFKGAAVSSPPRRRARPPSSCRG
jgi:threonine dehydrogenase-like Zn-dependent dehydrogenase